MQEKGETFSVSPTACLRNASDTVHEIVDWAGFLYWHSAILRLTRNSNTFSSPGRNVRDNFQLGSFWPPKLSSKTIPSNQKCVWIQNMQRCWRETDVICLTVWKPQDLFFCYASWILVFFTSITVGWLTWLFLFGMWPLDLASRALEDCLRLRSINTYDVARPPTWQSKHLIAVR